MKSNNWDLNGTISSAAQTHHHLITPYLGTANNDQGILNNMKQTSRNVNKKKCKGKQNVLAPRRKVQKAKHKRERTRKPKSSMFRGVCKYGRRYSAFLWDNTGPGPRRAVYIGVSKNEVDAAKAYDLAAIKLWGNFACTNFPKNRYEKEIEEMKHISKDDYLEVIKRKDKRISDCYSRYRGVSKSKSCKKWQARLGRGRQMLALYLGTFDTQEEAARAYDIANIKYKGVGAVTNFDLHSYNVKKILTSNLPTGKSAAIKLKEFIVKEKLIRSDKGHHESLLHAYQNPNTVTHNGFTGNVADHDISTVEGAPLQVSLMLPPATWTSGGDSSSSFMTGLQFQPSQPQPLQVQQNESEVINTHELLLPQSHDISVILDDFQDLNINLDQWALNLEKKEIFSNKFNIGVGDSPMNGLLNDTPAGPGGANEAVGLLYSGSGESSIFNDMQLQLPTVEPNSDIYQYPFEDLSSSSQLTSEHVYYPWSDSDQRNTTLQSQLMTEDLQDTDINEYLQSCLEETNGNCASANATNMGSDSDQTNTAFQSQLVTHEDLQDINIGEYFKRFFEETNGNCASASAINMGFAADGPVLIAPEDGNSAQECGLQGTNNSSTIPSNELVYHLEGEEYLYDLLGGF